MTTSATKTGAKFLSALNTNRLKYYEPYEKQAEFHALGKTHRERCFLAANQSGKTWSAGMEVAMHVTGEYPDAWEGRRFNKPVRCWVAGNSAEGTRDTVQRILLGGETPENYGTGALPKSSIHEVKQARGVTGAVAQIFVKHKSGGTSYIGFRNYEQDRDKWQGESIDFIWFDEEPPRDHYSEGLTRTNARNGFAMMTMTPLKGMTDVVDMFYPHPNTFDRALVMMTLEDVGHYDARQRERIEASYEEFEREARARGIPMLGSGRVFDATEESIAHRAFTIPSHWPVLGAIDFGYGGHPTGAVAGAWDRDSDTVYITHAYKEAKRTPESMALELKHWNEGMPWAWPHDGHKTGDRTSGITEAGLYRRAGLRMMRDHATFPDGGHGFEAGLTVMLERMRTGRFKVFSHLEPWWREYRTYHRKDGLVVKERDDLMSATRVLCMSIRCARPQNRDVSRAARSYAAYEPLGGTAA
jgi:phage terminase large subunit-like protein